VTGKIDWLSEIKHKISKLRVLVVVIIKPLGNKVTASTLVACHCQSGKNAL